MVGSLLNSILELATRVSGGKHSLPTAVGLEACVLEDRLLYSATILPVDMAGGGDSTTGFEITQAEIDAMLDCIEANLNTALDSYAGIGTSAPQENATSVGQPGHPTDLVSTDSTSVDATSVETPHSPDDTANANTTSNLTDVAYSADTTHDISTRITEVATADVTMSFSADINHAASPQSDYADASLTSSILDADSPLLQGPSDALAVGLDEGSNHVAQSIVFVDAKVLDADSLLAGLGLDDHQVFFLDGDADGIEQITGILSQFDPHSLASIHLIGHGGAGAIELGNLQLTRDNLAEYNDMLVAWSQVLSADADILIYGCEVAKTDAGQNLLLQISQLTAADVAGSTNITASAALGGDWVLEYNTGSIETQLDLDYALLDQYSHAMVTGTANGDFIVGTSAVDSHSGLGGNDLILGGANVASDGQFTSGTVSGNWSTFNSGSTMGGWSVTAGSVDLQSSTFQPTPAGGRSVDMDGNAPGTISQTISTVVGNTYVMRFMMTANATGVSTKALEVSIGGNNRDYSITTTSSHTVSASDWFEQTYVFTATSTSTTVQFRSLSSSGPTGAVIADVAVADLTANSGNDTIAGDDGNDTLVGSGGNDSITGGNGNDLIYAGGGTNTIDGGANTDIVAFTGNRASYNVTLSGSTYTVTDLRTGSPDGTNTISNVETFRFTDGDLTAAQVALRPATFENFDDGPLSGWTDGAIVTSDSNYTGFLTSSTSYGSPAAAASSLGLSGTQDVFKTFSLSGNQTSVTIAFNFYRIDSWDGENFIVWVNDTAVSTRAFTQGATSNYADTTSDSGVSNMGFQGWDEEVVTYVLTVNTTATSLKLGFGSTLDQNWNDEAWGVDNLSIREQVASTTGTYSEGTTAGDTLSGTTLYDSYAGGTGNDTLTGAAGNDMLSGGHGTDSLDGGTGSDILIGGWGADTISGGLGSDYIEGGEGADIIYGGGPNLILNGSFENSTTSWTASGQATSITGEGSVLGSYAVAFGSGNTANNGSLSQTVTTAAGSDYTVGFDYWAWGTGTAQSLRFRVISGGYTLIDQTVTATGNGSSPTYTDYVFTFTALGSSTQILFNDASSSTTAIDGVLDNVRLSLDDSGADTIYGGSGGDTMYGGAGDDVIAAGSGADTMFGDGGSDTLGYSASTAAVTVNLATGAASGGFATSDRFFNFENLTGSSFNDTLSGDTNDNTIKGGGGNDTISGSAGADTAVYSGNWSNYSISYNSGTQNYTVVDNRTGSPDGTDTLSSIEYLQFADRTLQTSMAINNAPSVINLNERSISITNSSFESTTVSDGSTTTTASGWTVTSGQGGTINPSSTQMAENVTSGANALYLNAGTATQTTSEVFSSTQLYTVMVDVGDRLDATVGTVAVRLYAGTVLLGQVSSVSVPEGGWQTVTLTVDGNSFGNNASALGQQLRVELSSSASQVLFDNVRVYASDRVLSIAENSTIGTVVGTAKAQDPDTWETATYSLADNAGGRFAINSSTGVITVANGSLLDHESATSHAVVVRATDSNGATFDRTVTIGVTDINEAPTDLTSGINLNMDGGNNAYLRTTNGGAIFGGRSALTLEVVYSMANNATTDSPLVSYAVTGSDNEVLLRILSSGALALNINGTQATATVNSALLDGKQHAIAASWDNTNGDVRFYIDGQLWSTTTGLKAGVAIQSGGTLVMGQDQDVVDGGYSTGQRFSGTLYGFRVWDSSISDEQIARNYQQNLATAESGLVADYRMSGLSGGNTVVDSVSGNNLTTASVAVGSGFTTSTTTASMSIAENSTNGTRVGQVFVTDAENSRDIAYDGLFREGTVAAGSTNYTSGQTFGGWTVTSGNVDLIGTSYQSSPLGGRSVDLNGTNVAGAIAQTLTTEVGKTYQVVYSFGGNFSGGDAVKDVRVIAGGTTQDFSLSQPSGWSASNVLWSNRTLNFTATSTSTALNFISLDGANSFGPMIADVRVMEIPQTVAAILAADPTLSYNAATEKFYRAVSTTTTWSAAQAAAVAASLNGVSGELITIGSAFENSIVQSLALSAGGDIWIGATDQSVEGTWRWQNGTSDGATFWIGTSTGTQQAGQWSNWQSGEPNDFNAAEDSGVLIASTGLWNDASGTNVARRYVIEWDASEVLSNYRYSLTDSAGGRFAINADTGEITLANTSLVNFESASSHAIVVRVTDPAGSTYDETMTINVTNTNDAPVMAAYAPVYNTVENASAFSATVATLLASSVTDEDAGAVRGIALYGLSGTGGTLQYSTNGGSTWSNFSNPSNSSALLLRSTDLVRFTPSTTNGGQILANYYAWDQTTGTAGGTADVTTRGGTTAFSAAGDVVTINTTNINDAPTITSGHTYSLTSTNEDTTSSGTFTGTILLAANWNDVDTGAVGGMAITGTVGNGTWQYSTDGVTWNNIGTVSNSSALLLTSTARVRYAPDGRNGETATFTYRSWDQTSGTASTNATPSYASAASTGGTTAFSTSVATATMSVTSVNDAPTDITGTLTIAENSANGTAVGTLSTADVDNGDTFTYALTNDAGGRFQINATTGQVTVANASLLDFESNTSHTIVAQTTDAAGASFTKTMTVSVTNVNETPTTVADTATAVEAGGVANATTGTNPTGNVLTNDTDPDAGDTKSVIGVSAGTVASASSNVGSSVSGSFGSITIGSNGAYTYTVDNSNATVQALRTSGNTLTDVFTYTMRDAAGLNSTTQITVTIQGANDAPTDITGTLTIAENSANGAVVGTLSTADIDNGDTFTYALTNDAGGRFQINATTGQVTVANASLLDFESNTSHTIVAQTTDAAGASFTKTMTVSVTNVNETPTAVADSATAVEAGGVANGSAGTNPTGNVLTNDSDPDAGDTKTVTGVAAGTVASASTNVGSSVSGSFGSITIGSNGAYTYTVDNSNATVQALRTSGNTLTDVFTYTMRDTAGLNSTTQITVTIQGANDAPTDITGTLTIAENSANGAVVGTLSTADIDNGDTFTYALTNDAGGRFQINATTGQVTVANGSLLDFESNASHTIVAQTTDAAGASSTKTMTVSLTNVNETPTAVADTATAVEAGGVANATTGTNPTGNVLTNDTDPDAGDTKSVIGVAAGTVASASTNVGSSVSGSFGSITIGSNGAYTYTVDNSNATVQALRTSGNTLTDVFTYTMRDTAGLNSTTQITVTIQGANDAPTDITGTLTIAENSANGAVVGTLSTADIDNGDTFTYALTNDAGGRFQINATTGQVTVANGSLLDFESNTSHTIVAQTTDAAGASSTKTMTVSVTNVNETPTAVSDSATAVEAGGVANGSAGTNPTGNVLTNDTDPDAADTKSVIGVAAGTVASASANVGSSVSGSFGSITIGSNGAYTYTVDNSNATVQALRTSGNTLTDVFTYTMRDAAGLNSTTQITVTIQGANDAPTDITGTLTVAENSANGSAVGTLSSADIDNGDTFTYALTNDAGGRFQINATTGQVTVANGSLLDFESNTSHTIVAQTTDAAGASFTKTMTVSVTNVNETPTAVADTATAVEAGGVANATTGTNPTGNVLTNDTDPDAGDTKSVIGVAAGTVASASTNVGSSVSGSFGSITIGSNGSYNYTVDNSNATVQALRTSGNTLTDVFTYTMRDAAGLNSTTQITVTIQGANDAPIDITGMLTIAENSTNGSAVGTLSTADVDNGDTFTYALTNDAGGRFQINATTGQVTVANGSLLDFESNASHTIVAQTTDAAGASFTKTMTVSVTNVNETPTAVADSATAVEAGGVANGSAGTNPTGNVLTNDTDPDAGDTKSVIGVSAGTVASASSNVGSSVSGSFGSITIGSNGAYTYTVDNSNATVQALRTSGNTLTDVFTYTMRDAAGLTSTTQITVTIQGANDAPTDITGTLTIAENSANGAVVGTLSTADIDNGDTFTYALTNDAGGRFQINATTGKVTVANASLLDFEINASHTIVAQTTDAAGASFTKTMTVSVTNVNETPTAVADTATAVEAGGVANGSAGTNPTGNVLTNDTDPDAGDTKTVTGVAAGTVASASTNVGSSVSGSFGSITIGSNGAYTYTLDNSNATVQALRTSGNTLTDVFTYTMRDAAGLNSTTQITVTIQGANDAPIDITGMLTIAENSTNGSAVGTLSTADVDNGDTFTYALTNDAGGRFQINATTGQVTVANGSLLDFESNTSHTIVAQTTDAAGASFTKTMTVSVTNVNETPTAVADAATAVEAGGVATATAGTNPTGNVLTNDTDPDAGDTQTVTGVAAGTVASASANVGSSVSGSFGSITIDSNGAYTYTVDNSNATVQALRTSGNTLTDVFTYTMRDTAGLNSTTQITVTIQGANDAPTDITGTLTIAENSTNGSAVGTLSTADVDNGDTFTYALTNDAGGRFQINATTGQVTVANGSLLDFESNTSHTIVAQTTDAAGASFTKTMTVSVTNVNETPTAVADTAIAIEAGGVANATAGANPTGNLLTNDTDVDLGDSKSVVGVAAGIQSSATGSVGTSVNGSYGSIVIASDGSYSYLLNNALASVQALRTYGDTLNDVFTYTISDTEGAQSTATVIVTIHGANDAPVAVADTIQAIETGGTNNAVAGVNPTGNVLSNDTDVDSGDTETVIGVATGTQSNTSGSVGSAVNGAYGSLTMGADGAYTYVVDNSNATVQALRTSGESLTELFSYTVQDAAGLTSTTQLTVVIQGANDAPNSITSGALAIDENSANGSSVGTVVGHDVDANDTLTYSLVDTAGGRFAINSNTGAIAVANSALLNYETATSHTVTVRVTDASGATFDENFTIQVRDLNEFAVSTPTDNDLTANAVDENSAIGTAVGITARALDADATNNTVTYSLTDSSSGLFQIDANTGIVTTAAVLDRELHGAARTITVQAISSDGSTAIQVFTVAINDIDEFDVGSVVDTNNSVNSVSENATIGTVVGMTALAQDWDATNNSITYSLVDNDDGRFAIHSSTGIVTVAGAIDRETDGPARQITIRATSSDGSFTDQQFSIGIVDVDEFDVGALTNLDNAGSLVVENATFGTTVGITAHATDLDATNNTITYALTDDDAGRFAIDSTTGVVTVAGAIDREAVGPVRSIVVLATSSDGSTSQQTFTINVQDVNEFDISQPVDSNLATNVIAENSANGASVGISAFASDADATTNSITYTLDGNAGGRFAIDTQTGVVTVADGSLLDYESAASHTITIRATSADGSYKTEQFTIQLTDVNETTVSAVSDADSASEFVVENSAVGTVVGITASAFDADGTDSVSYSLDNSAGGRFAIDATTGVVTVAGVIDREAAASYTITVKATSSDGSASSRNFTIMIGDVDEFDVSAPIDDDTSVNEVPENAAVRSTVGITVVAFDADATQQTATYSMIDDDGGRFTIDSNTGIVTVAGAINREVDGPQRSIVVLATSIDGSTSQQSFTINILDTNEYAVTKPVDSNATPNTIAENSTNGTVVGISASAFDLDATTNNVTYSLDDSASGRFAIDAQTGVVTVADGSWLDYETAASHTITIRATSADGSFETEQFTIQLTDVNELSVSAITDADNAGNFVMENSAIGAVVGVTAHAFDADGTDSVSYSLDDSAGGRFAIDASTGVVSVAGSIDREAAPSYTITVKATSTDGSSSTRNFTILIGDVDEFDVSAPVDNDTDLNVVAENAAIGTLVGITASAFDADATNNTITYALVDSDGGRFAIDANTGAVTVAGAINRETDGPVRNIIVQATSSDGSTSQQTLAIHILDANEFSVTTPVDSSATPNVIAENSASGTVVGITASAFDADATTNSISYSLDDSAGGRFAIDAQTGVVTVADGSSLDYETASSHTITVRATSADGSYKTQQFSIQLDDVNEVAVSAISDTDSSSDFVLENSAVGTVVGVTAFAFDADGTDSVSYSLDDNAGGRFAIEATTGVVSVASAIDRETAVSYTITVKATSTDGSTSTRNFTIFVGDIDEFDVSTPVDSNAAVNQVAENSAIGTIVGVTAAALDVDATNHTVTYSLVDNDGGRFAIDANTGVVTVAGAIDREADGPVRSIVVRATSSDGSTSQQTFSINILDVNEFAVTTPSDSDATPAILAENAANGTLVGITASAFDGDATTNGITYSLDDSASGRFAIDSQTGIVTVADGSLLDYEAATSHTIIIRATSADGSSKTQQFAIQLTDVNEMAVSPISETDTSNNFVLEGSTVGTVVGVTAFAFDGDGTDSVSYSLDDSAGGRFAINATTGLVTVAGAIDREAAAAYTITVRAMSTDGSSSTRNFTIQIGDVDEFDVTTPVDSDATANQVAENSAIGTSVGIIATAFDADATNNTITYSLVDNDGGRFAIDANTGVVTVAGSLDREADGPVRSIVVQATSSDGSIRQQTHTIAILDVNEFAVSTPNDSETTANAVAENAAVGTRVDITVAASDADATNNVISYSLVQNDGGRFAIDSTTGVVTVAGALNREIDGPTRSITVRATSADGSSSDQTFLIHISDVNEYSVSIPTDGDMAANAVAENATAGTNVGLAVSASDADATNNGINYSLLSDAGGRFRIDSLTGVITVAAGARLDYETAQQHTIVVQASSQDGSTATKTYTIDVLNVNESPTAGNLSFSTNNVQELSISRAALQAVMADPEGDALQSVITAGPMNGKITVLADGSLRYTANAGFVGQDQFTFESTDGQLRSNSATVTIQVTLPPAMGNNNGSSGTSNSSDSGNTQSSSTTTNTTKNDTGSSTVVKVENAATNSTMPMVGDTRSAEVQRSHDPASASTSSQEGVANLDNPQSSKDDQVQAQNSAQVSLPGWSTMTIGNYQLTAKGQSELVRTALRQLQQAELVYREQDWAEAPQEDRARMAAYAEPAKWTVISTGVVIWAVRLGHVITTLASTATAWFQFDPLTVIQSTRLGKDEDEDNITANLFEKRNSRK